MNRNLDILRATAVSLVLGYHLAVFHGWIERESAFSQLGRLGVLIFFVHTCMVLMMSLERHHESWSSFMVRRVFRIFPLSMAVVLAVNLLGIPDLTGLPHSMAPVHLGWRGVAANLLLVQNFSGHPSTPSVLWSLPYEIQMYTLLPALFILAIGNRLRTLLAIWIGAMGLEVLQRLTIGPEPQFLGYVPCFVPGVIAFALSRRVKPKVPAWTWPLFLGVLIGVSLSFRFKGANPVVCLTLGLAIPLFRQLPEGMLAKCAATVAKYSYGIYLGHLFCIWLTFVKLSALPPWAQWMLFAGALACTPVAMFHLIEQPMIQVGVKLARRLQKPAAVAAAAAAVERTPSFSRSVSVRYPISPTAGLPGEKT